MAQSAAVEDITRTSDEGGMTPRFEDYSVSPEEGLRHLLLHARFITNEYSDCVLVRAAVPIHHQAGQLPSRQPGLLASGLCEPDSASGAVPSLLAESGSPESRIPRGSAGASPRNFDWQFAPIFGNFRGLRRERPRAKTVWRREGFSFAKSAKPRGIREIQRLPAPKVGFAAINHASKHTGL
jgi:hypothetical protein